MNRMQDAKEEVRARLAIEDVIGEYVTLKRAGRNLKGLSPFTDERTPSFMVSPEKQIWHDFSSGKGGDIYSFIMLVEGLEFRPALELLARKAGVDLSLFGHGDGRMAQRRARAAEALTLAAKFFQQNLLVHQAARQYVVERRRLNRQMIEEFMIGYAPDTASALVTALTKRGFRMAELRDAGLVNRFDGDLFRGRMMVALSDPSGQIVGFTGRSIQPDPRAPKYLNTPQTVLFDKSRHIFGLHQAKEAIRSAGVVVIVEGNVDVVSSHQAGVRNVVATAGTAMTEQHVRALGRLSERVRLAFDSDRAGVAATERAISLAQTVGVELEVISLPAGAKDPDELIQRDPEQWRAVIDQAQPAVEWVMERYAEAIDLTSGEGKRRFSTAVLRLVQRLQDRVEQEHYMQAVAARTGVSLAALQAKLAQTPSSQPSLKPVKGDKQPVQPPADDREAVLLGLAVSAPQTRPLLAALTPEMLQHAESRLLLRWLHQHPTKSLDPVPAQLQKIEQYVKMVQLKSDNRYLEWQPASLPDEMARLVTHMRVKHRETKKQQLLDNLRTAEAASDETTAHQLRTELNALIKESL